jgi:hypothetical protein
LRGRLQKTHLLADGIREHGFKNETLSLLDQFLPEFPDDPASLIGINLQFSGDFIRIEEAQPSGSQVGMVEGRLPGAIRSSYRHQDWTLIQDAT